MRIRAGMRFFLRPETLPGIRQYASPGFFMMKSAGAMKQTGDTCIIVNNYSGALYLEIMKAVLGLEDGDYVIGEGFGIEGECSGELVFNTLMSGYMEALSDPSYYGQILMFTFPQIGNYGADTQNMQSKEVKALGAVCREICEKPDVKPSLRNYFEQNGLLGICGVDTRMLTIKTRVKGTLRAALIVGDDNFEHAVELAKKTAPLSDHDLIPGSFLQSPLSYPWNRQEDRHY
jgi:carbamoyl-phosphate synthase small subunit